MTFSRLYGVRKGMSPPDARSKRYDVYECVSFLISATCLISIYNIWLMKHFDIDLSFRMEWSVEAVNFRVGLFVQSIMMSLLCLASTISEVKATLWRPMLPFLEKLVSVAIMHGLMSSMCLGFAGGIGLFCACAEFLVGAACVVVSVVDAWSANSVEFQSL